MSELPQLLAPVYFVDDEPGVRDAVTFLLTSRGMSVRPYESGLTLLAEMQNLRLPVRGVFLLDIRMEAMSGMRLHQELLKLGLNNPVLFLTGHGDIPLAVEALKNGAFDFLEKPWGNNTLADRLERALQVEAAMHLEGARHSERLARLASLSDRERDVMHLVSAGKLNKVIAGELGVAVRTVEVHRARVFAKIGVKSAAELATFLAHDN